MMPAVQETIEKANREPNNFEAQMAAAEMYYRIQRFDDAAKFYERANQLKPDDYETVIKLGNVYFDGGKFEQAEKWYSQALAKNPADVNVRTDLGLTFFLRQPPDIERAVQEYRKSLAVNPNHELTLQNLSVALQQKGDSAGLQETIAQLEKVNPNNPAVARFKQQ
jgi:tetratricopeptide (TPR) repeat protein